MITLEDVRDNYLKPTKRGHILIPWNALRLNEPDGTPQCFRFRTGPYSGRFYRVIRLEDRGIVIAERTKGP